MTKIHDQSDRFEPLALDDLDLIVGGNAAHAMLSPQSHCTQLGSTLPQVGNSLHGLGGSQGSDSQMMMPMTMMMSSSSHEVASSGSPHGASVYEGGDNVVFAPPSDSSLAGHEAAHIAQQRQTTGPWGDDSQHEREAEPVEQPVSSGEGTGGGGGGDVTGSSGEDGSFGSPGDGASFGDPGDGGSFGGNGNDVGGGDFGGGGGDGGGGDVGGGGE